MSTTETSLHQVLQVAIDPVEISGTHRWQRIRFTTAEGHEHTVVAHLHETYAGLDMTPLRRVDDLPRQTVLFHD
jgi:hypothetical protein